MIRAEGLTKRFGKATALDGLTFQVERGEVFGFIGPNGAGKTTTLRILAGLCRPSSGLVQVDGVPVQHDPVALRRMTGYMPDFFGVYDAMTSAEYLAFYASCYRVPRRAIEGLVADLLQLVSLTGKRDARVDTLSRGMKQRLCLARALVHDPGVLLLDEPASGLDPRARAEMRELVSALSELGKTVLLSSHILPELAEMCSSFGIIHNGRMVAVGPAASLLAEAEAPEAPESGAPAATTWKRVRVRVKGDIARAEGVASAIPGVVRARRTGPDLLEITRAAGEGERLDGAALLRALVLADVAVFDFREEEGGLEQLFLRLTSNAAGGDGGEAVL